MIVFKECPKRPKLNCEIIAAEVKDMMVPPLGVENYSPLFREYGMTVTGIADDFFWFKKECPDEDIWHMAALCYKYWKEFYQYIYEEEEYEKYKDSVKEWSKSNPEFLKTLKQLEQSEIAEYGHLIG